MSYLQSILGSDERVVYMTRRHWLVIARTIIVSTLLSLVIFAAAVALTPITAGLSLLLLVLLVLPLFRFLNAYLHWWNEQYIVTNRRIVQIEGIINKHVIDSSLEKVNDVVMDQSVMGRIFGFGDIEILTASDIGVNKLEKIANPIRFKTTMLNQKRLLEDDNGVGRGGRPSDTASISALIEELARLRDRGLITEAEFQAKRAELLSRL